jgi:hypothetical protein
MIKVNAKGIYFMGSVREFQSFLRNTMCFDIYLKELIKVRSQRMPIK